jgi:protein-disulfide isomerase
MTSSVSLESGARPGINSGVATIGFVLAFLAGGALVWGYDQHDKAALNQTAGGSSGATASATWSDADAAIPITSADPTWGSRTAPVTIVEFSDFQCPFCGRAEPAVQELKAHYGKDKLRFVWKDAPLSFHEKAKPAAEAAEGVFALAGNDAFWKFHDTAFKNQAALGDASYLQWAKDAGVTDLAKLKAGLAAHTWADKVDQGNAAAKTAAIPGAPAFFVNGVLVSGAQPLDKYEAVIDQELQKAQAKLASGTPADKVYVVMSQENHKSALAKAPAAATGAPGATPAEDTAIHKVALGTSPILGKPDALVTVVEFSDFQCPFCKRVEDTLKQVKDTYGDKVRFVWKNQPLPFHDRAEPCAELAMEAKAEKGDKGFWDVHDRLFASNPKLDDASLDAIATAAGLNLDKVHAAVKGHTYKKDIDADSDLAEQLGMTATPNFFINGKSLVGAVPFDQLKTVLDAELGRAQALAAKGVPGTKIYDETMKTAVEPHPPVLETKTLAPAPNAPARGNLKAKVVIQELSDFQCPFCARAEPTLQELMKEYGDRVKLVWRNMPLPMHQDAPLAAEAAMEAYKQKGNDGFWKMHDTLFANQKTPNGLKRAALEQYASDQGLDLARFKSALDNSTHQAEIDADVKSASDAQITAAPGFLINGYFVSGALPRQKFEKVIDRALAEAR